MLSLQRREAAAHPDIRVVAEISTGNQAVVLTADLHLEVVLCDVRRRGQPNRTEQ